ncbi:MAG TPA: iron ABC transporter permease [Polyangiaceae bacterium]|nr:iron ABC transporter permease [Polyangiaceae bacterium]
MNPRYLYAALTLLLIVSLSASIALGAVPVPLLAALRPGPDWDWVRRILWSVRLPRALCGCIVGAALSSSGLVLQSVFRNPLAEPSVLGVSGCAALAAQLALFSGLGQLASYSVPLAAVIGAAVGISLLLFLVRGLHHVPEPVLISGVALGQLALAVSALLLSLALRDYSIARRLLTWLLGGLDGRTWLHVLWGVGPLVAAILRIAARSREIDALTLGDTTALAVGVDVARSRRELVLIAAVLSGIAVAIAGIVGFVGLIIPYFVKRWLQPRRGSAVWACALAGGSFVVLSDLVARLLIAPEELQIGAVSALFGAPLFAWLLLRRYRELAT